MERYIKEEISYKGYTIKIIQDDDSEDPRNWDNLGTMICFHRRYNLGDYNESKKYDGAKEFFADIAGVDYDEFDGSADKLIELAHRKNIILPLYLYDHSGITMSTSSFNDRWDSGQVGWIYVSKEKIKEEWKWKHLTATRMEKIKNLLRLEVEVYDQYLTGDVWGYEVEDSDGEHIDSCWGYFGDEGIKNALSEAEGIVDYEIKKQIKSHIGQLKTWIKNKVPLLYRKPLQLSL